MKTQQQVLEFLQEQIELGNDNISASIGNGGSGLEISNHDITQDIENMNFDGECEPCEDLKTWSGYDPKLYTAYQFSDNNGFKIQVLVW